MKIESRDYPFTIIIEDKISKKNGKPYQSISIGHTVLKNKDATDSKEKYDSEWFNMFNEEDLLKISSLADNAYRKLVSARNQERKEKAQAKKEQEVPVEDTDDGIPF